MCLYIEVAVNDMKHEIKIQEYLADFLKSNRNCISIGFYNPDIFESSYLRKHCISINFEVDDCLDDVSFIQLNDYNVKIYIYELEQNSDNQSMNTILNNSENCDENKRNINLNDLVENDENAITICCLPHIKYHGTWENLYYDDKNIKNILINYSRTSLYLNNLDICHQIISWNSLILLFGPPGTGKTSLCCGLAQKIAIRNLNTYSSVYLIEINTHSLFSKYYSESGKLVNNLFTNIKTLLNKRNDILICLLIDEVESISVNRKYSLQGNEPSDSIRVVNALLTQIDSLKNKNNILILTTSNITEGIDPAFIDRADLKLHLPLPSQIVVKKIIKSFLEELIRVNILLKPDSNDDFENKINFLIEKCSGISGRNLKKLPYRALTLKICQEQIPFNNFIQQLELAVKMY